MFRLANYDRTSFLDLWSGRWRVQAYSWTTQPPTTTTSTILLPYGKQESTIGYQPLAETVDLAYFAPKDSLRTAVIDLETWLINAAKWHDDPDTEQSIWLEWSTEGEPIKRTLLYGGSWEWIEDWGSWPHLTDCNAMIRVAFNRHPFWESCTPTILSITNLNGIGDHAHIVNIPGDVPARIYSTNLKGVDNGGGPYYHHLGIRRQQLGDAAFDIVLECELGGAPANGDAHLDSADWTNLVDADRSNNYVGVCDFSVDTTNHKRIHIHIQTVVGAIANCSHFNGRYQVLAAAKVDAITTTCYLQMVSGWEDTYEKVEAEPQAVTSNHYRWISLGNIQIPPPGAWHDDLGSSSDDQSARFTIELWAERLSVAGSLYVDCLLLIPTDYFLRIDRAPLSWTLADLYKESVIITRENDDVFGANLETDGAATGLAVGSPTIIPNMWYLPEGNSVLVYCAAIFHEQSIDPDGDNQTDLTLTYFPRWLTYRT